MTDHTFATPTPIQLDASVLTADIRIVASDRVDTVVEFIPGDPGSSEDADAIARVRVVHEGGTVRIKEKRNIGRSRHSSFDVHVQLPARSSVDASSGTGDITMTGQLATAEAHSGTGDVSVGEAHFVRVASGSGDVAVTDAHGHARLKSGSGDVRAGSVHAGLDARSGTGDIQVDAAHSGVFDLKTGTGDIALRVPEGVAALLDITSGVGSIDNQLTSSTSRPDAIDSIEVRATSGTGDVIIARTTAAVAAD